MNKLFISFSFALILVTGFCLPVLATDQSLQPTQNGIIQRAGSIASYALWCIKAGKNQSFPAQQFFNDVEKELKNLEEPYAFIHNWAEREEEEIEITEEKKIDSLNSYIKKEKLELIPEYLRKDFIKRLAKYGYQEKDIPPIYFYTTQRMHGNPIMPQMVYAFHFLQKEDSLFRKQWEIIIIKPHSNFGKKYTKNIINFSLLHELNHRTYCRYPVIFIKQNMAKNEFETWQQKLEKLADLDACMKLGPDCIDAITAYTSFPNQLEGPPSHPPHKDRAAYLKEMMQKSEQEQKILAGKQEVAQFKNSLQEKCNKMLAILTRICPNYSFKISFKYRSTSNAAIHPAPAKVIA